MLDLLKNQLLFSGLLIAVLMGAINLGVAYCTFYERKISAWIQNREGPNRVGFFGLFWGFHFWGYGQPMADGLKFLLKEEMIPDKADKPLYVMAPAISFIVSTIGIAVIPWGGYLDIDADGIVDVACQVANPDIGLLYVLGVGSLGVYGVVLGAWASNNKYSLFGGIRAAAQMLSYEIPLGLAILVVVLSCGEVRLENIVRAQIEGGGTWNVFVHPLAFFLLFVTQLAETNRAPFDMAESEQELVGGFHTEYGALKFALFFLSEYTHMIINSAFLCVLFLGGWHFPWIPGLGLEDTAWWAVLAKMAMLGTKIAGCVFVYMWIRWTLPRFRFDQLMRLAWKGLIPTGLGLVALAVVMTYFGIPGSESVWPKLIWGLGGNAAVLFMVVLVVGMSPAGVTGRQANMPPISLLSPAKRVPRADQGTAN